MSKITTRMLDGGGRTNDAGTLKNVADNIAGRTVCAFGEACSWPTQSFLAKFPDEFEAAASGVPVCFGPSMSNFREIAHVFLRNESAAEVHSAAEVAEFMARMLEQPEMGGHVGFMTGPAPGRIDWLPQRILRFFDAVS